MSLREAPGCAAAAAAAASLQSCPTLCDPTDGSPPGSPVPGILQARTLEWAAISFSNAWKWKVKVKSCPTLSNPMDCSPPGSSILGIFQAKVLEWGCYCLLRLDVLVPIFSLYAVEWGYWESLVDSKSSLLSQWALHSTSGTKWLTIPTVASNSERWPLSVNHEAKAPTVWLRHGQTEKREIPRTNG